MTGLIVVVAVTSFPYVFVFTNSALDLVSSEMEDAANILGAGTVRTTFRVTLPLVLPAILGGLIISFLEAIALFGAPALIALPARFQVVSTQLWQFFEYPGAGRGSGRLRDAAAADHASFMFWLQRCVLGRRGYATVTGKGGERRMHPARAVALGDARLCAVRLRARGVPADDRAAAGGVRQGLGPRLLARQPHAAATSTTSCSSRRRRRTPIINTFVYSGVTAFAAIALSLAIAYVVTRKLVPWSNVLAFLCMAPFVIPGHRAGDRLLCRLCAAAARALRHRRRS